MKTTHSPIRTALVALFAALPVVAQAHPGHSAFDWFTAPPHAGHGNEYAVVLAVLGLFVLGCGAYWLASRKR